ncbi:MAG: DUF2007 domain-containing protein [Mesorhizobium sp.]
MKGFDRCSQACHPAAMIELVRTNDPVIISFIEALLRDAGIVHFVAGLHKDVPDDTAGMHQRRIMVDGSRLDEARQLVIDAGAGEELNNA